MYRLQKKTEIVRENTTLMPKNYGGWLAVNTGTAAATVDNFTLQPGEGLDFTKLQPDVLWNEPIKITLTTGAIITIVRFIYKEV